MAHDDDIAGRVLALIAAQTGRGASQLTLDTELVRDLGLRGDKAATLMEWMHREFEIDMNGFQFERHFEPQGAHGWPWLVAAVVAFPVAVALLLLAGTVSAVAGLQPGRYLGAGGLFALAYLTALLAVGLVTVVQPALRARRTRQLPLTVRHLIDAATHKAWPLTLPEGDYQ